MCNIIIVDDHLLFRESMKLFIEKEGFGQVIAEAQDGLEFLECLKNKHPDLVIMDIEMPYMDGIEATRQALKIYPDLKILLLSMLGEQVEFDIILRSGATAHILKSSGKREFEKVLKKLIN